MRVANVLLVVLMVSTGFEVFAQTEIISHDVQFDSSPTAANMILGTTNVDLGNDTNRIVIACSNDAPAEVQWYKSDTLNAGAGVGNIRFFAGLTNPVQVAAVSANAVSTNPNAADLVLWTKGTNSSLQRRLAVTSEGQVTVPSLYEYTNKIFNVTNNAPISEVQSFLNGLSKSWQSNITITVNILGTNYWSSPLVVSNFTGRGCTLLFQGNVVSNDWHTNQTSVIVGTGAVAQVFQVFFNDIDVKLYNTKVLFNSTNAAVACHAVYVANSRLFRAYYCMFQGTGTSSGDAGAIFTIRTEHNDIERNMFNNSYYGIIGNDCVIYSAYNTNYVGNLGVPLSCYAGVIYRNGSQPTGIVANTWTLWGGQIY